MRPDERRAARRSEVWMENAAFANPPKVDNWIQKRYHEPKRNAK